MNGGCLFNVGLVLVTYKQKNPDFVGNLDSFITSYVGKKWVVMDSNHRRHSQQIYSLPHLATLVTTLAFQKRLQRYCFYFVPPNILAFIFIFPFVFLLFGSFFLSIGGFCRLFLSKSVFFDEQPFGCTFVFFFRNDSFRLRFV